MKKIIFSALLFASTAVNSATLSCPEAINCNYYKGICTGYDTALWTLDANSAHDEFDGTEKILLANVIVNSANELGCIYSYSNDSFIVLELAKKVSAVTGKGWELKGFGNSIKICNSKESTTECTVLVK